MPLTASPNVQQMRDLLATEDASHSEVLTQTYVMIANGQDQFHSLITVEKPGIVDVRDVVNRIIEIEQFVVITVHEGLQVEGSAHRNTGGGYVGMTQGKVQGVIASEAAPAYS